METCFPSSIWGPAAWTVSTQLGSLNVTKPNPRDFPVAAFITTTQSATSPNRLKYASSDAKIQQKYDIKFWQNASSALHYSIDDHLLSVKKSYVLAQITIQQNICIHSITIKGIKCPEKHIYIYILNSLAEKKNFPQPKVIVKQNRKSRLAITASDNLWFSANSSFFSSIETNILSITEKMLN